MEDWVKDFLSNNGPIILYVGTFSMLVLCGLGVPFPEEATFLIAGYAAQHQKFTTNEMLLLCFFGVTGILIGDSFPFMLGRRYGMSLLSRPRFAKIMTPKRIEWVREHFHHWGNWTVFGARFLAGVRMPTFFVAATMGVPYFTFVFLDFLGAMISCPTSIYLAWKFGKQAEEFIRQSHVYIFGALGLAVAYMVYHYMSHREKPEPPPPVAPTVAPESEKKTEQPAAK